MKNAVRFSFYFAVIFLLGIISFPHSHIKAADKSLKSVTADYDGDGKSDFVTVRTEGDKLVWWISYSTNGSKSTSVAFGNVGDRYVPADYDGDGKTDIAVWRPAQASFYIMQSKTQTTRIEKFGLETDDPSVVADYDGDGRADLAVYRPGTPEKPQSLFYYVPSMSKIAGDFTAIAWGLLGDDPAIGDYDGDGKADLAVRRSKTSNGQSLWYIKRSKEGDQVSQWGLSTDAVAVADYDGDGKTDITVMRHGDSGAESRWQFYVLNSSNGQMVVKQFGLANNDLPVPGDYDGDGRSDVGLWRKTDATFWVLSSNVTQDVKTLKWGNATDTPVSVPRGK